MKKDLHYELATRKFHRPNPVFYFIYWFACRFITHRRLGYQRRRR